MTLPRRARSGPRPAHRAGRAAAARPRRSSTSCRWPPSRPRSCSAAATEVGSDPRPARTTACWWSWAPAACTTWTRRCDYAGRLAAQAADELRDDLCIAMRVYFEKPRTTTGWKGMINDPHLDGSGDVNSGLRMARGLLLEVLGLGLPVGCEFLDPITPQYISDAVAWGAIGARTTESQIHRQLGSGLSMPVGFKNRTDGNVQVAVDAVRAAAVPHAFAGVDESGAPGDPLHDGQPRLPRDPARRAGRARTTPAEAVADALEQLRAARPARAARDRRLARQQRQGPRRASRPRRPTSPARWPAATARSSGVMLESFLVAGRQEIGTDGDRSPTASRSPTPAWTGTPPSSVLDGAGRGRCGRAARRDEDRGPRRRPDRRLDRHWRPERFVPAPRWWASAATRSGSSARASSAPSTRRPSSLEEALEGAAACFACAPVGALPDQVSAALAAAPEDCVVTDVGSTKRAAARPRSTTRASWAATRSPGAETSGVEHARADLFQGAVWYLTPTRALLGAALRAPSPAAEATSAPARWPSTPRPTTGCVAVFSHLPHVLANVLVAPGGRAAARPGGGAPAGRARASATPPAWPAPTRRCGRTSTGRTARRSRRRSRRFARSLDEVAELLEAGGDVAGWNDAARERPPAAARGGPDRRAPSTSCA